MTPTRGQARDECNYANATEREEEACERLGTR